jgi:hypothetical protein
MGLAEAIADENTKGCPANTAGLACAKRVDTGAIGKKRRFPVD